MNRRSFLKRSAAFGSVMILPSSRAFGANERLAVGMMGVGGKGIGTIDGVKGAGCDIVAVCDPDKQHMERAAKRAGGNVKQYQDFRDMLEDKTIDAIVMCTPHHWHALGTVMACQAGKDVYVEKPACHSIWEGRKMVEAARKYDRIVQVGSQQRSDPALIKMKQMIAAKEIGEVQWAHALWYADRPSIGKVSGPIKVPEHIDYDLWCGPREKIPLMRKKLHYDWHWRWEYGNGDMGNRVIHNIDDVHHVLQLNDDVPTRMMAVGGRFGYNDDANTPNTEVIVLEGKVPIIASSRNLPLIHPSTGRAAGASVYRRLGKGLRFTTLIKCEGGFFAVTRGGGKVYDNDGKTIKQIKGNGGRGHIKNWVDAIKSRNRDDLKAEVEQGHLGCLLLHTGNISYRVGQQASCDAVSKQVAGIEEAESIWGDTIEHLKSHNIDLAKERPTLGPWLTFDPKQERFTGQHADAANAHVKERYRKEFTIPEQV
jgi:predicted dehydrogenase